MTVLEDVRDLVRQHSPAALCDDCIAQKLGLSIRQHANHKSRRLATMPGFERRKDVCSSCGSQKLVISSP
ncbi:MAG: hypothetical protein CMN19_07290 [Roseovarius sp.]|nr:hypothetical protein [Roseovarius sp.]MAZ20950.1 hypothetical protein [Roseovarius sp.]